MVLAAAPASVLLIMASVTNMPSQEEAARGEGDKFHCCAPKKAGRWGHANPHCSRAGQGSYASTASPVQLWHMPPPCGTHPGSLMGRHIPWDAPWQYVSAYEMLRVTGTLSVPGDGGTANSTLAAVWCSFPDCAVTPPPQTAGTSRWWATLEGP